MPSQQRTFEILFIEDNPGDAALLEDRLKHYNGLGTNCRIQWLINSVDVIPFLRSPERASYRPDLIILDYKMPIDGGRALTELKGDPDYLHIPVLVLTGVEDPRGICDIYRPGANCCYHKSSDLDGYDSLVETVTDHWLTKVCVPSCPDE